MKSGRVLIPIVLLLLSCSGLNTPTPVVIRETVLVEVTRILEVTSTAVPATPTLIPAFFEDFSGTLEGWTLPNAPGVVGHVQNGRMRIELREPNTLDDLTQLELNFLNDFDLSFNVIYPSGPTDSTIGVNFDLQFEGEANLVSFTSDGQLYVGQFVAGGYRDLIPWHSTDAFRPALEASRVRLTREGFQVSVYGDDRLLASLPLDPLARGYTSITFQTWAEGGAVWELDNVELRVP